MTKMTDEKKTEIISLSLQYNIPLKLNHHTLNRISDRLGEWEDLLEQAEDLHIDWNSREYDPVALGQLIEEEKTNIHNEMLEMRREYNFERGVV